MQCDSWITSTNALTLGDFLFVSVQGVVREGDIEKALGVWFRGNELLESVLQASFVTFWSTVAHSSLMDVVESFFGCLRPSAIGACQQILFKHEKFLAVFEETHRKVSLLLIRLLIRQHNHEFSLSEDLHMSILIEKRILSSDRLVSIIALFSQNNHGLLRQIFETLTEIYPNYSHELLSHAVFCGMGLENMIDQAVTTLTLVSKRETCPSKVIDLLETLLNMFGDLSSLISFDSNIADTCGSQLVLSIPTVMEQLERNFTITNIAKVIDCRSIIRNTLSLMECIRYCAVDIFDKILSSIPRDSGLLKIVNRAFTAECFIFHLNILHPLDKLIENLFECGILDSTSRRAMNMLLNNIISQQIQVVLDVYKSQGLFEQLGNPFNSDTDSILNDLCELLPQYSRCYMHLCLRNFGYDTEKTTNALFNIELLPLDLRALCNVELTSQQGSLNAESALFHDEEYSNAESFIKQSETGTNALVGLNSSNSKEKELFDVESVWKHIQRITLSCTNPSANFVDERYDESNNGLIVLPKRNVNFSMTESEKAALRPTYQNYAYVDESDVELGDIYDDEYDDSYDAIANFDPDWHCESDPLPVERILRDVEPNLNRDGTPCKKSEASTDESESEIGNRCTKQNTKEFRRSKYNDKTQKESIPTPSDKTLPHKEKSSYTGGRERQIKERNKGALRQKLHDRKNRSVMF